MQQELLNEILKKTFRYYDLVRRVRILKSILTKKHFGATEIEQKGLEKEELIRAHDQTWLESLDPKILEKINKENLYQIFTDMEKTILELKYLIIYLTFEINEQEIEKLGNYLRQSYGQNFLYETSFDPDLIGGCALSWNGNYKDYSLRSKINDNKQTVLESLRKVLN